MKKFNSEIVSAPLFQTANFLSCIIKSCLKLHSYSRDPHAYKKADDYFSLISFSPFATLIFTADDPKYLIVWCHSPNC